METPIESLNFSEREKKYYTIEFEQITSEQKRPLIERELNGQVAAQFLRQLKIKENDLSTIWSLVSEHKPYLKLPNFMAAMRLCSALKQGKPLVSQNYLTEQNVLARRNRNIPNRNSLTNEDEKKSVEDKKAVENQGITVIDREKVKEDDKIEENKVVCNEVCIKPKELMPIPLQVSQEVSFPKFGKFEDMDLEGDQTAKNKEKVQSEEKIIEKPKDPEPENSLKANIQTPIEAPQEKLEKDPIENSQEKPVEKIQLELEVKSEKPLFPVPIISKKDMLCDIPSFTENPDTSPKPQIKDPSDQKPIRKLIQEDFSSESYKLPESSNLSPSSLETKSSVEEVKAQPKLFPRVPSLPKIYKSLLSKIPEEITPPKSSSSRDPQITVENPVLITSGWLGSSSYYIYTIVTRVSGKIFTVKRRFSDLDWMHYQLVSKYKGFIIPSRPDKKLIKNTDEKFIEERRLQMEKYLNIIAKHPILGSSIAFKIFTQTANEKFDKEKSKAEAVEEYQEYRSLEDAVDKVFALVQNKFQIIFSQKIVPFSKEMSEIEEKLIKLEAPIQTLSGSFSHWSQISIESNKIVSSMKLSSEFSIFLNNFKALARSSSQDLTRLSLEVKEEQLRLEGLKEALNTYKITVEECCKLQTLISRKLGKHKSSSDEDTAARYLNEIQSTQDTIDKYNKTLTEIEENVIKENLTFDSAKSEHLDLTIRDLVYSQKNHYAKEAEFWKSCLNLQ
ncbi:hypothetical protein SteCoe_24102 [Stentor coeruleus]|uniref:PX domain-containing protein n=1 Tax=Stentor coeruleus TaxID=5963 RepID=A0A1R2BIT6_9CILI|nr:hypothetical protein SteCoe_24102 [Stentor coeruleus]